VEVVVVVELEDLGSHRHAQCIALTLSEVHDNTHHALLSEFIIDRRTVAPRGERFARSMDGM
jgi:hypothetical protein